MAFAQLPGPPASPSQLRTLLSLLNEAGHGGLREARGPMHFSQRQAGGRFTRDEAARFIEQLEAERDGSAVPALAPGSADELSDEERALRALPSRLLAAELARRGWRVSEP